MSLGEEQLHKFIPRDHIIRMIKSGRIRWERHVAHTGDIRKAYEFFVVIPRRRWKDNIKTNLRDTVWDLLDWIHMAQDGDLWRALPDTVMSLRVA
jgi:hypothetical protein